MNKYEIITSIDLKNRCNEIFTKTRDGTTFLLQKCGTLIATLMPPPVDNSADHETLTSTQLIWKRNGILEVIERGQAYLITHNRKPVALLAAPAQTPTSLLVSAMTPEEVAKLDVVRDLDIENLKDLVAVHELTKGTLK